VSGLAKTGLPGKRFFAKLLLRAGNFDPQLQTKPVGWAWISLLSLRQSGVPARATKIPLVPPIVGLLLSSLLFKKG